MMLTESYVRAIRTRLSALGKLEVSVEEMPAGVCRLRVRMDELDEELRVTREGVPASGHDVRFIGNLFSDIPLLLEALGGHAPPAESVAAIGARVQAASPGPWTAFIESDGGAGGADVIRVSENDNQPDMYLWIGANLAPSAMLRFVAEARQDVPALMAALGP